MASDSPSPSRKRQRTNNDPEDTKEKEEEEEKLLLSLQTKDGSDEDDNVEERRIQRESRRKERWRRIQQEKKEHDTPKENQETIGTKTLQIATTESVQPKREAEQNLKAPPSDHDEKEEDDGAGSDFDMFTSSVSPPSTKKGGEQLQQDPKKSRTSLTTTEKVDDWQDSEGYYKAVIGETLAVGSRSFSVLGVVGKGVFSTVLKCSFAASDDDDKVDDDVVLPATVALKCIRNNETMAKAALNEIRVLQALSPHPHVVQLLLPDENSSSAVLEYRGHVVMVFGYHPFNLRHVLQKFGKGVGLSLAATLTYFRQLLSALRHLQKHGIVHADLKPDNILVDGGFASCCVCDFGSAFDTTSPDAQTVTPYMVSRFYRAPEIILGQAATHAADLWSVGVTVAELFGGKVLFGGKSNNDMLYQMMQRLGPFATKTIRQHLVAVQKVAIPAHFEPMGTQYSFLQRTDTTAANGKTIVKQLSLQEFPTKPLPKYLLQSKSANDTKKQMQHFTNLLQRVMTLEPNKRITVGQALSHEVFTLG